MDIYELKNYITAQNGDPHLSIGFQGVAAAAAGEPQHYFF